MPPGKTTEKAVSSESAVEMEDRHGATALCYAVGWDLKLFSDAADDKRNRRDGPQIEEGDARLECVHYLLKASVNNYQNKELFKTMFTSQKGDSTLA